jgi:hypothetical protein
LCRMVAEILNGNVSLVIAATNAVQGLSMWGPA